jgi:hypothetical protein
MKAVDYVDADKVQRAKKREVASKFADLMKLVR